MKHTVFWPTDQRIVAYYSKQAFTAPPHHLPHTTQQNWQINFGRAFRALKLWFVLRLYGLRGLQEHIRKQVPPIRHPAHIAAVVLSRKVP